MLRCCANDMSDFKIIYYLQYTNVDHDHEENALLNMFVGRSQLYLI